MHCVAPPQMAMVLPTPIATPDQLRDGYQFEHVWPMTAPLPHSDANCFDAAFFDVDASSRHQAYDFTQGVPQLPTPGYTAAGPYLGDDADAALDAEIEAEIALQPQLPFTQNGLALEGAFNPAAAGADYFATPEQGFCSPTDDEGYLATPTLGVGAELGAGDRFAYADADSYFSARRAASGRTSFATAMSATESSDTIDSATTPTGWAVQHRSSYADPLQLQPPQFASMPPAAAAAAQVQMQMQQQHAKMGMAMPPTSSYASVDHMQQYQQQQQQHPQHLHGAYANKTPAMTATTTNSSLSEPSYSPRRHAPDPYALGHSHVHGHGHGHGQSSAAAHVAGDANDRGRARWTAQENALLVAAYRRHCPREAMVDGVRQTVPWSRIARELGGKRSGRTCGKHFRYLFPHGLPGTSLSLATAAAADEHDDVSAELSAATAASQVGLAHGQPQQRSQQMPRLQIDQMQPPTAAPVATTGPTLTPSSSSSSSPVQPPSRRQQQQQQHGGTPRRDRRDHPGFGHRHANSFSAVDAKTLGLGMGFGFGTRDRSIVGAGQPYIYPSTSPQKPGRSPTSHAASSQQTQQGQQVRRGPLSAGGNYSGSSSSDAEADLLSHGRVDVASQHTRGHALAPASCSWSEEEDRLLSQLVEPYLLRGRRPSWERVGAMMQPAARSGLQAQARWSERLADSVRRSRWTKAEDESLVDGVRKFGRRWGKIAATLLGRTQRQCLARYLVLTRASDEDFLM